MTLVQSAAENGEFSKLYNFDSINWEKTNLQGNYIVTTNPKGDNFLEVNTQVTSETPFNKKSSFGVGWGIGLSEGENPATEAYLALWSF